MKNLTPEETELSGDWVLVDGRVHKDAVAERIDFLIREVLVKVAVSPEAGAWETLFRDPTDGRYWERIYLRSYMHGGGPPTLRWISKGDAEQKYGPLLGT